MQDLYMFLQLTAELEVSGYNVMSLDINFPVQIKLLNILKFKTHAEGDLVGRIIIIIVLCMTVNLSHRSVVVAKRLCCVWCVQFLKNLNLNPKKI